MSESSQVALIRYVATYQRYLGVKMYLIFLLTMVSVLADSFGLVLVFPILQSVMGEQNFEFGLPAGVLKDVLENGVDISVSLISDVLGTDVTASLILLIIAVFFAKAVLVFGATAYNSVLRARLLQVLKSNTFQSAVSMDFEFFSGKTAGHFTNLLNEQSLRSIQCFYNLTQCLAQITSTLIYIAIALMVSYLFAAIVAVSGVMVVFIYKRLNQLVENYSLEMVREKGLLSGQLIQFFQNFGYLTATNLSALLSGRVLEKFSAITQVQKKIGIANALTKASQEFMVVGVIMSVMLYFAVFDPSTLPRVFLSVLLLYRAVSNILGFQLSWQSTLETAGSISAIESELTNLRCNQAHNGTRLVSNFNKNIVFKNVHYDIGGTKVLKAIDLKIESGKSYAIVGPSGSGKSTLTRLITGLVMPSAGNIFVDGEPLSQLDMRSWRQQIGLITQDPVIFDDTIFYNVALRKREHASAAEISAVESLMDRLNLTEAIAAATAGYDTRLGERGLRFSGGQRQRIFLAREIFRDPEVLILDEATSALDRNTELVVQRFLDEKMKGKTLLLVAHRLETVTSCDYVVYLRDGVVCDVGSYIEVRGRNPEYFAGVS